MDFFTFRYRNREDDYEDPRRDFLVKALTLGLFAVGGPVLTAGCAGGLAGRRPGQLPPGQSIYRRRGNVRVNGLQADEGTRIGPDATIETGSNSELIFVVGKDAFIIRENSTIELYPRAASGGGGGDDDDGFLGGVVGSLRAVSGKILSVFGQRGRDESLSLRSTTATIGIRGTGLYLEAESDRSYICTCYGQTLLAALGDPDIQETITASHHDAPRYIYGEGRAGRRIEPAPVINHTDMELLLIEELVGRTPPFSVSGSDYDAPRKISY